MSEEAKELLKRIKELHKEVPLIFAPPEEGLVPQTQQVIPRSLVRNTRGYIEKITHQVNGCYENGWYDACAVMTRRLLETLIIEAYEYHNLAHKIKNQNQDFLYLNDLIQSVLSETSWNIGRNTKKALPKLKDIGDQSAHSRRFTAQRSDIEKLLPEIRIVVQELLYLANLK